MIIPFNSLEGDQLMISFQVKNIFKKSDATIELIICNMYVCVYNKYNMIRSRKKCDFFEKSKGYVFKDFE